MASWIAIITSCLLLFGTILVLIYVYFDRKFRYWQTRGLKSPSFYDFLCSLPKSAKTPMHLTQLKMYKQYGRLYGQIGLFSQLSVAEPYLIKQILVKDFHVFRNRLKRIDFGNETFQGMLSVLCDDDWRRVRCIMSPTFSSGKMRKMAILVTECAESAANYLAKIAEKDEEIDIKQFYEAFSVDVIAVTAFATKINSLNDPNNEFMANAKKLTDRSVPLVTTFVVFLLPRLAKLLKLEFFPLDSVNYYRETVLNILKEREKTKVKGHDFLQLMMNAKDDPTDDTAEDTKEDEKMKHSYIENLPERKTMTLDEIVSQSILFFIAGQHTTSLTLSFVAYNLALNPDCQEKLISEVQDTWEKHGKMDFDIVTKMPYLDAVMCESQRITATNIMIMRDTAEDYKLGDTGITVPKGTNIVIPVYAMHRDPEWFPNPEKFDPDRFLPENKHLITPFTYLPFGDGPRNCIGMRFIIMVMKLCLVYTLKDMKFVATEETKKPLEYFGQQGVLNAKKVVMKVMKQNR